MKDRVIHELCNSDELTYFLVNSRSGDDDLGRLLGDDREEGRSTGLLLSVA